MLVSRQKNAHIFKGRMGEVVQEIMKQAKEKNNKDTNMTVLFDKKRIKRKTDSTGQAKSLSNIASNVNQI